MASGRTTPDFRDAVHLQAAANLQETTSALATGYQETPTKFRHLRLVFKLRELLAFQKELDYLADHESSYKEDFETRFETSAEEFFDLKREDFRNLITEIAQEFLSEKKFAEVVGPVTDAESYVTTEYRASSSHSTIRSTHSTISSSFELLEQEIYAVLNGTVVKPPVTETEHMLKTLFRIIAKHFLRPLGQGEFADAREEDKLEALIGCLTRDHFHPSEKTSLPNRVHNVVASGGVAQALIEKRERMLNDLKQKIASHFPVGVPARNVLESIMVIINPDYITSNNLCSHYIHPNEIDPEEEDDDSPPNDLEIAKYFVRMEDVLKHLINSFDTNPHPFATFWELEELSSRVEAARKGHCYRFSKTRLAKLYKKGLIMGPPLGLVTSSLLAEFGLQMPLSVFSIFLWSDVGKSE